MSDSVYVGLIPRFLSNGRPIMFGDVLRDDEVLLADDATRSQIVSNAVTSSPKTTAIPAPAPAAPPAPAPQEVVNTGNPS